MIVISDILHDSKANLKFETFVRESLRTIQNEQRMMHQRTTQLEQTLMETDERLNCRLDRILEKLDLIHCLISEQGPTSTPGYLKTL